MASVDLCSSGGLSCCWSSLASKVWLLPDHSVGLAAFDTGFLLMVVNAAGGAIGCW